MDERAEAVAALRVLKDEIESLIDSGLAGDAEQYVERLAEACGPAMRTLFALWPSASDDDEEDAARGPVVTVRTRTDYVIDDPDAVIGDDRDLATAMYDLLHDQGLDRYLHAPGLRLAISVTSVHSGPEALELPEEDVPNSELLGVGPDERELRGIIDVF